MNRIAIARKVAALAVAWALPFCTAAAGASAASASVSAAVAGASAAAALPESVDNSTSRYFPAFISQVGGSCAQASYIGYMFTYEMNRLLDRDGALPQNTFSYIYTWNFINEGKDQGSFGFDGLRLAMDNGVALSSDFPNQTTSSSFYWMDGYDKYYRAMHYRIKSLNRLDVGNMAQIDAVRQYLYNHDEEGSAGGVVTFSCLTTGWTFDDDYRGPSLTGYHSMLTGLATDGGHALTIVGYDDTVEFEAPDGSVSKGAFIVANSWGENWHDRGRFYLPYWFFIQEGRDTGRLSADVCKIEVDYREPTVVFNVDIECDSRDDLAFKTGASEGVTASLPTVNYERRIANHQGGDYNMQGRYSSSRIRMSFDFTSADNFTCDWDEIKYFLTVSNVSRGSKKAGVCRLYQFSVTDYRNNVSYVADLGGEYVNLGSGDNVFSVATADPAFTSYCPIVWLNAFGCPLNSTFIFKTASEGEPVKVKFLEYDRESGVMRLKYKKL